MSTDVAAPLLEKGTFRGAWAHRRWRWLLGSFAISMTGDFLYLVALMVFLLDRTDSTAWVSAAVVVRMIPYVVLGPIGGVLADRFDRRRLMVTLDLVRVVLLSMLAVLAWADGPPLVAIVLAFLASAANTPYRPAAIAATPLLVGDEHLAAANAAETIAAQLGWFVGPALGALVVTLADPGWAFALNAMSFAVAGAMVWRIGPVGGGRDIGQGGELADGDEDDGRPMATDAGVRATVRFILADRGLSAMVWFTMAALFTFGVEQVVYVLVARDRLDIGAAGVGVLSAAIGIGGLLVAPLTARLGDGRRAGLVLIGTGLAAGLPMIVLALTSNIVVACMVLAVEGAGAIVFEVVFITLLQRSCPENRLAQVYGVQDAACTAALLVGSATAPVLVVQFGLRATLWIAGSVALIATLAFARALTTFAARVDEQRRRLAPDVALLRGFPIFAGASQATLEECARTLRRLSYAPHQVVFNEGDTPEDLYLVVDGELAVWSSGERGDAAEHVNTLTVGDWFGEIGLLRRSPRTATVTTTTPCELLALDGTVFVATLADEPSGHGPLHPIMATRLARTHPSWTAVRP